MWRVPTSLNPMGDLPCPAVGLAPIRTGEVVLETAPNTSAAHPCGGTKQALLQVLKVSNQPSSPPVPRDECPEVNVSGYLRFGRHTKLWRDPAQGQQDTESISSCSA